MDDFKSCVAERHKSVERKSTSSSTWRSCAQRGGDKLRLDFIEIDAARSTATSLSDKRTWSSATATRRRVNQDSKRQDIISFIANEIDSKRHIRRFGELEHLIVSKLLVA